MKAGIREGSKGSSDLRVKHLDFPELSACLLLRVSLLWVLLSSAPVQPYEFTLGLLLDALHMYCNL